MSHPCFCNKSYYEILEIPISASLDEIRKAYKKQALKTHPDKILSANISEEAKADAEALFRQVHEAFEILSDPQMRRAYDIRMSYQDNRRAQSTPSYTMPMDEFTQAFHENVRRTTEQARQTFETLRRMKEEAARNKRAEESMRHFAEEAHRQHEENLRRCREEAERRTKERQEWARKDEERHKEKMRYASMAQAKAEHAKKAFIPPGVSRDEFAGLVDVYLLDMLRKKGLSNDESGASKPTRPKPRPRSNTFGRPGLT